MLVFAILAALSIVFSYMLPETFSKRPPEMIPELESNNNQPIKGSKNGDHYEKYLDMVEEDGKEWLFSNWSTKVRFTNSKTMYNKRVYYKM